MISVPLRHFNVNVWGCMAGDYKLHVYRVDKHFNSALYQYQLRRVAIPMMRRTYNGEFIFQQDNARIHTTIRIRNLFVEENLNVLQWPPYSPDLSPIENLWALLKKRTIQRVRQAWPTSNETFFDVIKEEAAAIDASVIKSLYDGMPRRIRQLISNNFGNTTY